MGRPLATFGLRLMNQPGLMRALLAFLTPTRGVSAHVAPAGIRLVGYSCPPTRCAQADAARAVLPPYAARAAQPSLQSIPGSWNWEPMIKPASDTRLYQIDIQGRRLPGVR